jgi:hypothetical protein
MRNTFLTKYQDYYKARELREEIFKLTQKEEENLKDYLEKFLYNIQIYKQHKFELEIIITIFLRGLLDESIIFLNLMQSGDVSQLIFEEIFYFCRRYSQSQARSRKGPRDTLSKIIKSATSGVTRAELGNLLEIFKTDFLGTLSLQLNSLQFKKNEEDGKVYLSIFCSKCREKHPPREYPLDNIKIYVICAGDHLTEQNPALPGLKAVYQGENQSTEQ